MEKIDLTAYLKDTVVVDSHKYRDMPYIDKSRWRSHKKCGRKFQLQVMKEMQGKSVTDGLEIDTSARDMGSNSHLVFSYFFKAIIDNDLIERFMKIPLEEEFKGSRIYYTFLDICNQILPVNLRMDQWQQRIISNFCEYEKDYWNYISREFGHKKIYFTKFFIPIHVELYMENYDMLLFGTIDAMYNNPLYKTDSVWGDQKYTIIDYKTGGVPKPVKEGTRPQDLPSDDRQELHFYAWLATHAQIQEERENPVTMVKEIVKIPVFPDLKEFTDVIANMVWLGDLKPYYLPPINMNSRSMDAVFGEIRRMRDQWTKGGDYPMVDIASAEYACKSCDFADYCNAQRLKEALGE